jgi:hypothetical protein
MKKNYIKPDIKTLKMGTSSIICASSNQEAKNGKFIIGDDAKFEAKYDKKWTISGDVEFDTEGEYSTR